MPTDLERDLGLYAVVTVSVGAMIGSGIFVLPGIAFEIAGPAAILAYLLAGLIVLPAALSKAEMGTAMPESGGTYLYIDRAMGPFFGTIAGVGAWFSLVFKSAFALVGLGAYLLLFVTLPAGGIKLVALGLGALLIAVNVVGVKQSGRLQSAIVTVVLVVLFAFIADGLTFVDAARYHPFFGTGSGDLLAATGFIFVSYAGVTKIASIAEEVEAPGRNLPLGILISMGLMMLVYTFIVFVVVGVSDPATLRDTLRPMAVAAEGFLGRAGDLVIAAVAVLALTSMANAGILSSSRYPLAMSRDSLAPPAFQVVSDRFRTPTAAIGITGGILLVLVAFVPVIQLAKLASAFQILVFSMVNLGLIAFREADIESYDPSFEAPGYPWVQLFGIVGGLVLVATMGALPLAGAVGIVLAGVAWYRIYGRDKTEREGAALDAIRRRADRQSLDRTRRMLAEDDGNGDRDGDGDGEYRVLLPLTADVTAEREEALLRIAATLIHRRGGSIRVVQFENIPEQTPLEAMVAERTPQEISFEEQTHELAAELDVPVEVGEIAAHDVHRAMVNFAESEGIDAILTSWEADADHAWVFGRGIDRLVEDAPCDVVFVEDRGVEDVEEIAIVADTGPYDPLKIAVADAIATETGATLRFLNVLDADANDAQIDSVRSYHAALDDLCAAPTDSEIVRGDAETLIAAAERADIVVMGVSSRRHLTDVLFGTLQDTLIASVDRTVILVHSPEPRSRTVLRAILEWLVYRRPPRDDRGAVESSRS
ncbi:MAG: amino acid permease [Haloarculaceae archaeon]